MPLLRLDFGALYNKYHGETERNLRDSLRQAEMMRPCTLWIDEIEKGLGQGDSSDGGVSRRVLGTLLTWMSESAEQVFIVATANDIDPLPPELLRKGRLDEIFFVDLPEDEERQTIFHIHLQKRSIDSGEFDLGSLSNASTGFSGAEIEQAVVAGLYAAHATGNTLTQSILLEELGTTSPLFRWLCEERSSTAGVGSRTHC